MVSWPILHCSHVNALLEEHEQRVDGPGWCASCVRWLARCVSDLDFLSSWGNCAPRHVSPDNLAHRVPIYIRDREPVLAQQGTALAAVRQ